MNVAWQRTLLSECLLRKYQNFYFVAAVILLELIKRKRTSVVTRTPYHSISENILSNA